MSSVRIGLLLDDLESFAWVQVMLEEIQREPGLEIALVVRNAGAATSRRWWQRLRDGSDSLLYRIWRGVDRRLFPMRPNAFAPADLREMLDGVPVIEVNPSSTGFVDAFSAADIERIKAHHVDVFLRLGFHLLRGEILSVAPAGVWSLHHGDNRVNRTGPAGVWEVLLREPTTGSLLQMRTADVNAAHVLDRSVAATDSSSVNRNLNHVYWKAVTFVPRRLRELRDLGADAFRARYAELSGTPEFYSRPLHVQPRNTVLAPLLATLVWRGMVHRLGTLLRRDQWTLYYRFAEGDALKGLLLRYEELRPPRDRFWADPCAVEYHGRHFVFIEELVFSRPIGRIAVIEFGDDDRPILPPRPVLSDPTHHSYPFVFEDNGTWFMIPENKQTRTVPLYRATSFPDHWEFVMNLMENVILVDVTVWPHAGRYWMFANVIGHEGASTDDELFLFHADTLQTMDWHPHPLNPIVSDVRHARPAGRIFEHRGEWYRPAQDSSRIYGRAMVFHRIDRINEQEYAETIVSGIEPDWAPDIIATHTYSRAGRLAVVDARRVGSR